MNSSLQFDIEKKHVAVFSSEEPNAPLIYLNTFDQGAQELLTAAGSLSCPPFSLIAVSGLDWNHDLVPWPSPAAFRGAEPFTAGADAYLRLLLEEIRPRAEAALPGEAAWRGILGYSLAGLFALYALYQTDLFSRMGSISGSLWFPGLRDYVLSHSPKSQVTRAYFSLGSKESKTRNPVLKSVLPDTEAICAQFQALGSETLFQPNPGNHHDHAPERTAAGVAWLLRD